MQPRLNFPRRDFHSLTLGALLFRCIGCAAEDVKIPPLEPLQLTGDLQRANNAFAVSFLKTVEAMQPGDNQVVSPFSIESALLMTMEGARNQTAQEMGTALALPESVQGPEGQSAWQLATIRSDMQALLQRLGRSDADLDKRTRKRLERLRAELRTANQEAKELMQSAKYKLANELLQQAQALANEINQLAATVDQYDLQIANSIWAEKSYSLAAEFSKTVTEHYHAGVQNVDFINAAEAQRELINQWVSEHTQQKINDLIPSGALSPATRMVLANAVYFRGTWQDPFEESRTETKDFYNQGITKTQLAMMSKWCATSRYAAFNSDGTLFETPKTLPQGASPSQGYPQDGVQIIELAYNGEDLSMLVILPTRREGLSELIRSLSAEQIDHWTSSMTVRRFEASLPRFKLEINYDLNDILQRQGMTAAFDPATADFTGMGPEDLFISKVLHKAFIEVNEKGTEAAAATAVVMTRSSAPIEIPFHPQFVADHPFLFLIRHRQSGIILFMGKVESL